MLLTDAGLTLADLQLPHLPRPFVHCLNLNYAENVQRACQTTRRTETCDDLTEKSDTVFP